MYWLWLLINEYSLVRFMIREVVVNFVTKLFEEYLKFMVEFIKSNNNTLNQLIELIYETFFALASVTQTIWRYLNSMVCMLKLIRYNQKELIHQRTRKKKVFWLKKSLSIMCLILQSSSLMIQILTSTFPGVKGEWCVVVGVHLL